MSSDCLEKCRRTAGLVLGLLVAGLLPRGLAAPSQAPQLGFGALPKERIVIPRLRGIVAVPDAAGASVPPPAGFGGVDVSRVPLLAREQEAVTRLLTPFLERPASLPSLDRIAIALRIWLRAIGQPFVTAYVPAQDVSDGVIRLVVEPARLDGPLAVTGAHWFSENSYRADVPARPGQMIDGPALRAGVDRLNRNPYHHVVLVAEPGATPGTTRLILRAREVRPWQVTAGYNNSGTAVTDENRLSTGVTWGDAFGRGDLLGYSFSADPALQRALTHAANYRTTFASGQSLSLVGNYATVESALPAPLTQKGRSWQAGAHYDIPLGVHRGVTEGLTLAADFKYSDNNLEFASIPITAGATNIVEFGATYALSFAALGGQNDLAVTGYGSPGGLTSRNRGRYFEVFRAGAKARYAYATLHFAHERPLGLGFAWRTTLTAQVASGALLGTEQLDGGGAGAVRGYGESTAFGDEGLVANNELHLPGFSLVKGRDRADLFAFADFASLHNRVDNDGTDLRSVGLGLNYQWSRHFSLQASYGWQLKRLATDPGETSHAFVAASTTW